MKEIFRETAHLQELQGVVAIVLAGDRMEDSPAVGFLDDINDALFEAKFLDAIFDQHAIPERVIEIPHDAFPWFCFAVCRRAVAGRAIQRNRSLALDEINQAKIEGGIVGLVRDNFNFEQFSEADQVGEPRSADFMAIESTFHWDQTLEGLSEGLAFRGTNRQSEGDSALIWIEALDHKTVRHLWMCRLRLSFLPAPVGHLAKGPLADRSR